MNKAYTKIILVLLTVLLVYAPNVMAGNKDRIGQAGASELLFNPWGRSAGFHGMNTSLVRGIESMRTNVAGLTFTGGTEILFANNQYAQGSGVSVNGFGFAQRLGEEGGVLGVNVVSMSLGEIDITTVGAPEGGTGATFNPQLLNIGLGYARSFSNSIHVGILFRLINEGIADVSASGFGLDLGIQYVTGPQDNIRFGISLRNIGTPMRFSGDGLATSLPEIEGEYNIGVNNKTEKFELPSLLHIGGSYDFNFNDKHRLTVMGNFTSNSFSKDHIGGGLEYAFNKMFMLRGAYRFESGISSDLNTDDEDGRSTFYTGLSAGASVEVPFKKDGDGPALGIDYAFRATSPYNGTHTIGVRLKL